jgi:hypothetical protein
VAIAGARRNTALIGAYSVGVVTAGDVGESADRLSLIAVKAYSPDSGLVASVAGQVT